MMLLSKLLTDLECVCEAFLLSHTDQNPFADKALHFPEKSKTSVCYFLYFSFVIYCVVNLPAVI